MDLKKPRKKQDVEGCPVFITSQILGKKWSILVIQELLASEKKEGPQFGDLQRALSWVSPKVLTQRLRELEHEEIVDRIVDASVMPAHVHYQLTEKGKGIESILRAMQKWGLKFHQEETSDCIGKGIRRCSECTLG